MSQRRVIYFLAHILLVAIGAIVSFVGYSLADPAKTVLIAVGTSLVAAGAAGMIVWVYLSQVETQSARLETLSRAGLDWIYSRRAAQIRDEYATRLQAASDQIDIMGFGLKDFRRDYIDDLGNMSARARIRILIIDPTGPYAAQRDVEEGQTPGTIRLEVEEFVTQFAMRYSAPPNARLQLKYYTCLPLLNVFRIDSDLFFGPYLAGKASGNTFTLRVGRGSTFDQLTQHFDEVWQNHTRDV